MLNKTKVIATIGPSTMEKNQIQKLIEHGTDVLCLNMSHSSHSFCRDIIEKVNEVNNELGLNIAIMFDLVGPEMRTGKFISGQGYFRKGEQIRIHKEEVLGDSTKFSIEHPDLIKNVERGTILKIQNGTMLFEVTDIDEVSLYCTTLTDGELVDSQTVLVENVKFDLPLITKKDKEDIKLAHEMDIDFLAISYVTSSENIKLVHDELRKLGNEHISLIAKIENEEGVNNIDEIISASDGVMIAREDLGVEVPFERIPGIQKKIVSKCHTAGIVSIVSTELLSSMERSIKPTRAEVSDVANAVLDGADAVMLSGETTIGKFPIETLSMMEKIITSTEKDIEYMEFSNRVIDKELDITDMISYNVVDSASKLKCCAVITPTKSGETAKKISRYRPLCPIIAFSSSKSTVKSLQLNFGVNPVFNDHIETFDELIRLSRETTIKLMSTKYGDKIIITGGYPFSEMKGTNFLKIEEL